MLPGADCALTLEAYYIPNVSRLCRQRHKEALFLPDQPARNTSEIRATHAPPTAPRALQINSFVSGFVIKHLQDVGVCHDCQEVVILTEPREETRLRRLEMSKVLGESQQKCQSRYILFDSHTVDILSTYFPWNIVVLVH